MRWRTAEGSRLKRLATAFAQAKSDLDFLGATDPADHEAIRNRYRAARRKLWSAIERLTSIDDTPRSVLDQ